MGDNGTAAVMSRARPAAKRAVEYLGGKQLKLVLRVTQVVNAGPGIYRFNVIHERDGRWRLAVEGDSRLEELGDS